MSEHTCPYVPEAMFACPRCYVPSHPARLFWMDLTEIWLCDHCLQDLEEPIHSSTLTLADHLTSLAPRWVPVSDRLPEPGWEGYVNAPASGGERVVKTGARPSGGNEILILTLDGAPAYHFKGLVGALSPWYWLDFTPPPLPGEDKE